MTDRLPSPTLRFLQGSACVVIILWGVRAASSFLVPVLMGLLIAYSVLPLPTWLMKRFNVRKPAAIALVGASMVAVSLGMVPLLSWRIVQLQAKLPVYHEHFMSLYGSLVVFLRGHGIDLAGLVASKLPTSDQAIESALTVLPQAVSFLGDGFIISVLALVFLVTMAEQAGARRGLLAEQLAYFGGDVQRYVATAAKTAGIAALANFVLLAAFGVDFPLLWCVLYFFMSFIPNIGFIISLTPPILLALLESGWKVALWVGGGLISINLAADYVLTPMFMKKGVDVSFLEIILSLMFWTLLLGPLGAILAVPLTLSLRKFIDRLSSEEGLAKAPSG